MEQELSKKEIIKVRTKLDQNFKTKEINFAA